jgi:predicted lipoprotein with Yx(FWY)xxD motif
MNTKLTLTFSGTAFALLALTGCSSVGAYSGAPTSKSSVKTPSGAAVAVGADANVATTPLGTVVVDGKGMTAYFYDMDTANSGKSACTGGCASTWPAITSASARPTVIGITGTVGTIPSSKQLTINGRPIYTYANDTAPGTTVGQGVGGVWYVISPSGSEVKSSKPTGYSRGNY